MKEFPKGTIRYLQLEFDPTQYTEDIHNFNTKDEEVYSSFQLLVRRKAKENNFKSVLTTITHMLNE